MTRGDIKQAIKDQVDDQSISDSLLNEWVQAADDAIQTWRQPPIRTARAIIDKGSTFDFWDYLKEQKNYSTSASDNKFALPDNYRAFLELRVDDDTDPYKLKDFRERDNYDDHICWILGKFLYIKAIPSADDQSVVLTFVHFSDPFSSDNDEPEIESPYHQAYVAFGKSRYYNLQGDSELENDNLSEFHRIMSTKRTDQELARMASANDTASVPRQYIV